MSHGVAAMLEKLDLCETASRKIFLNWAHGKYSSWEIVSFFMSWVSMTSYLYMYNATSDQCENF